ncbi:hypothetical protein L208DRAFT_1288154 [Tricholoma matsutake]|nr:hypothetical protein L208DRAFT_1288154 [Tricholoma matsutake 945]
MTKIVNCLSAKMEMGSPMICLYLLDNPGHYTNYTFVPFYWQSFVSKAHAAWNTDPTISQEHPTDKMPEKHHNIVGFSPVDDYLLHAPELESVCLYDWISHCQHVKIKG